MTMILVAFGFASPISEHNLLSLQQSAISHKCYRSIQINLILRERGCEGLRAQARLGKLWTISPTAVAGTVKIPLKASQWRGYSIWFERDWESQILGLDRNGSIRSASPALAPVC